MIKKSKIPTIIGLIILIAGTFAGVYFLKISQVFKIGASATVTPKDIRTSNLSDTSATISWITEGATTDFITWGETQGNLNKIEKEGNTDQKFFTHSITLTGLKGNTTYFYKIVSEGINFDNNGIPWQFTTGEALSINQYSNPVSGSVITPSGQPSKRALVYITIDGYLLSTLTSDAGNFVLQTGAVRTSDLKNLAQIDSAQTLLAISVEAEGGETATAQIFPQSANPAPPIILGKSQDFRGLGPAQSGQNPSVNLNLPEAATQESKFDTSVPSGTPAPTSVILESLEEGETVTSNQPQFFGKGPAGESVTITVHSGEPVSANVKIPKNGSWSWSPPVPLSTGNHSITISWVDSLGITKTLTRNFVVQAGEAPAFTASQSGQTSTPVPTPTPTSTPKPTVTPKPTATSSPTSPEILSTPTASPAEIPVTGNLTPTLLLSIMGVVVIAFGFFVWKFSEN